MNAAIHYVVALSPEAFAFRKESPFPCTPRYGREVVWFSDQELLPSVRRAYALLRDFTRQVLEFFDKFTLVLLPKGAFYFVMRKEQAMKNKHLAPPSCTGDTLVERLDALAGDLSRWMKRLRTGSYNQERRWTAYGSRQALRQVIARLRALRWAPSRERLLDELGCLQTQLEDAREEARGSRLSHRSAIERYQAGGEARVLARVCPRLRTLLAMAPGVSIDPPAFARQLIKVSEETLAQRLVESILEHATHIHAARRVLFVVSGGLKSRLLDLLRNVWAQTDESVSLFQDVSAFLSNTEAAGVCLATFRELQLRERHEGRKLMPGAVDTLILFGLPRVPDLWLRVLDQLGDTTLCLGVTWAEPSAALLSAFHLRVVTLDSSSLSR